MSNELFDYYIAGVMESWRATHTYELCTFRTRPDFQMTGRRSNAVGDEFAVSDVEYADDTGMPFCSRADAEEQIPLAMQHFVDWGLLVHAGVLDPLVHSGLIDSTVLEPANPRVSPVATSPRFRFSP